MRLKEIFYNRWFGVVIAVIWVVASIIMVKKLVDFFDHDEREKAHYYAEVQELLINSSEDIPQDALNFYLEYLEESDLPMIILDDKGSYVSSKNINPSVIQDSVRRADLLQEMHETYLPITIMLPFGKQYIYYKNSELFDQIRFYPLLLIVITLLFGGFSYWYYMTVHYSEQNSLWAGMAKETAHQIGTPISSLMGWVELLKLDDHGDDKIAAQEMQKDIDRLRIIAERFSKIGSIPELKKTNLVASTLLTYEYMKSRLSKNVELCFESSENNLPVFLSEQLYSWVIENMIKNAVDALQGRGAIKVRLFKKDHNVIVAITDTGSGIPKHLHKKIFEPGFTTKKRGWGLGLSLAKRIVETYHKGSISVYKSDKNMGTEMRITLRILND